MNNPLNIAPRSFNRVEVDERRGTLTKTSSHKEKLRDEIRWYLKIPKQLQCFAPRVFSYSPDSDSPSMTLEFYSYRSLHEYFMTAWGGQRKFNLRGNFWEFVVRRREFSSLPSRLHESRGASRR